MYFETDKETQNSWYMDEGDSKLTCYIDEGDLKLKAYLKRYEDTNETERNRIISKTIEKINHDFRNNNINAHLEKAPAPATITIHLVIDKGNTTIGFPEMYLINDDYNETLRIVNYLITSYNENSNHVLCPIIPLGNTKTKIF